MLTGMRAFPTGLGMSLGVRVRGRVHRRDLNGEVFDGPYTRDMDADWQAGRLKWGFEFADGGRVTNVDPHQATALRPIGTGDIGASVGAGRTRAHRRGWRRQ